MKLLITGIPGTGKTTIGNYLQTRRGYLHFDTENVDWNTRFKYLGQFLAAPGNDKVITWGFVPERDAEEIRKLQQAGFRMIWFDGDREAAHNAFLKRGGVSEELFNLQMLRINAMDLTVFSPVIFNPFDENGAFLHPETIVNLILNTPSGGWG